MVLKDFEEIFDSNPNYDSMSQALNMETLSNLDSFDILDLFCKISKKQNLLHSEHLHFIYNNLYIIFDHANNKLELIKNNDEELYNQRLQWIHFFLFQTLRNLCGNVNSDSLLLNKILHSEPNRFEYVKQHPNYRFDISDIVRSNLDLLR